MKEGQFTQKLLRHLRKDMPGAVILKHCNPYTAGVPDFSVTHEMPTNCEFVEKVFRTSWCEVKLTTTERGSHMFNPLQVEMAKRMDAWYLIWSPPHKCGRLFRAQNIQPGHNWLLEKTLSFEQLVEQIKYIF